jgi:hypothetical protein
MNQYSFDFRTLRVFITTTRQQCYLENLHSRNPILPLRILVNRLRRPLTDSYVSHYSPRLHSYRFVFHPEKSRYDQHETRLPHDAASAIRARAH